MAVEERIVVMQTEDGIVSLEREDGTVLYYSVSSMPTPYKEGDIVKVLVHNEDCIEFIELDEDAMRKRKEKMMIRAARIRARAHKTTNLK